MLAGALAGCGSQPSADQTATASSDVAALKGAGAKIASGSEGSGSAVETPVRAASADDTGNTDQTPPLLIPLASPPTTASANSATGFNQAVSLPPKDDCTPLPGWSSFRERLEQAIRSKNAEAFAALASADIRLDYGGGSGRAELLKRLGDPKRGLWQELEAILPLGCATDNGLTVLPWFFWKVPDDIDPYTTLLAAGADVPLLVRPDDGAKVTTTLNWALVRIKGPLDRSERFTKVTVAANTSGYVRTSELRSLLDYRLIAENKSGEWRVTAFIAGD